MSAPAPDQNAPRAVYATDPNAPQAYAVDPNSPQAYQYVTPQPVQYVQQPGSVAPGMPGTPVTQASPGLQYSPAVSGTPGIQYGQPIAPGTPGIQYVQPVAPGTPGTQFMQPSPEQQAQMLQQPFYPQSPMMAQQPVYTVPGQQPVVGGPVIVESHMGTAAAQPATTIVTKPPPQPGLAGRLPFFKECCFCIPLHAGGMTICGLMILFYGILGFLLVLGGNLAGSYGAILIVIGVVYLLIAVGSVAGFAGIYKEKRDWVDKYVLFFIIGSFVWFLLEIIELIISIVYYNNLRSGYYYSYYSYNVGPWIAKFIIGLLFQSYFCSVLASYQRVLHARTNDFDGKEIMMH